MSWLINAALTVFAVVTAVMVVTAIAGISFLMWLFWYGVYTAIKEAAQNRFTWR